MPLIVTPLLLLLYCRNEETFPRLADPLGYVDKDDIFHAIKAIVATQRDYGRRDDRKQARLKYLVHEWGMDKFRCGPWAVWCRIALAYSCVWTTSIRWQRMSALLAHVDISLSSKQAI
jgi:hypothetical protein